jgi:hypothetical protein
MLVGTQVSAYSNSRHTTEGLCSLDIFTGSISFCRNVTQFEDIMVKGRDDAQV